MACDLAARALGVCAPAETFAILSGFSISLKVQPESIKAKPPEAMLAGGCRVFFENSEIFRRCSGLPDSVQVAEFAGRHIAVHLEESFRGLAGLEELAISLAALVGDFDPLD